MHGKPHSHRISRRNLLQVGSIGGLGISLRSLLASEGADSGRVGGSRISRTAKSCIFIVQYGGASQIDSLDPKPRAPDEIRGPYQPIATRTAGLEICELLPRLAQHSDKFSIIRSMTHTNGGHDGGMHVAMTGHSMPKVDTPYLGSVVTRIRPATRNIPSYVWLQNLAGDVEPRYLQGGFLGAGCGPLRVGHDLDNPAAPDFRVSAFDPVEGTTPQRLRSRQRLLHQIQGPGRDFAVGQQRNRNRQNPMAGFDGFQEQAFDLIAGSEARAAFDLLRESDPVRARYGNHPLGQNLLMARRLVEAGVRLVSVTAWCGLAEGEKFTNVQTWDMHGPTAAAHLGSIFGNGSYGLGFALPRVDQSVSALLEDMEQRGMLNETLVVLVGEFGRAPRVVQQGRDHWPACYSALIAGGDVQPGVVYGASDPHAAYVQDKPVTPEDFSATLFCAMGIDPATRIGLDGFTHPASSGQPIEELLRRLA